MLAASRFLYQTLFSRPSGKAHRGPLLIKTQHWLIHTIWVLPATQQLKLLSYSASFLMSSEVRLDVCVSVAAHLGYPDTASIKQPSLSCWISSLWGTTSKITLPNLHSGVFTQFMAWGSQSPAAFGHQASGTEFRWSCLKKCLITFFFSTDHCGQSNNSCPSAGFVGEIIQLNVQNNETTLARRLSYDRAQLLFQSWHQRFSKCHLGFIIHLSSSLTLKTIHLHKQKARHHSAQNVKWW